MVFTLLCSGCTGEAEDGRRLRGAEPAVASCQFSHWIGKPVNEIPVKTLGRPYRVLPPNSVVTMDHIPNRINLYVDKRGIVTRVRCG
jgi:hypothetical protein